MIEEAANWHFELCDLTRPIERFTCFAPVALLPFSADGRQSPSKVAFDAQVDIRQLDYDS